MALVTLREILKGSVENRYAVGSFNAANHSMAEAILEASEELGTPVILAVAEVHFRYFDLDRFAAYVRRRIEEVKTPVALHLDHGRSTDVVKRCLDLGFSSVMIDASQQPYEDNVRITDSVVQLARTSGASVKAELGCVGGGEGNYVEGSSPIGTISPTRTWCPTSPGLRDALLWPSHGARPYKGQPVRLERSRRSAEDGCSLARTAAQACDEDFRNVVASGINKVNFTECSGGSSEGCWADPERKTCGLSRLTAAGQRCQEIVTKDRLSERRE